MGSAGQDDIEGEPLFFPSQDWFTVYQQRINDNDAYAEAAAEWGVEFDGDFVFEMQDLAVDSLDVESMPADLRQELTEYVTEENESYTGYSYVGLEAGQCTAARLIHSPTAVDAGFQLTATTDTWKDLIAGDLGIVDGMLTGRFDIDGDMQKVMQYSDAAIELTEIAASIDAEFADEAFYE